MVFLVNLPERPLAMLNLESDNDGKRLKTAGDSLCTDVASPSEKIERGSPDFSEGKGTSVHRLQVSALHFWSKTKDIKNKQVREG